MLKQIKPVPVGNVTGVNSGLQSKVQLGHDRERIYGSTEKIIKPKE